MIYQMILFILAGVAIYFIFRYVSLILAVLKIRDELDEACQDLTRNQMIHLPMPDRHLAKLLCSVNAALEGIQKERQRYEKREREFQAQIENISHDLRTPLTVMIGYLRLFRKSEIFSSNDCMDQKHELLETVSIMEQKAEVMNHLVTQFYDYSRLNAGSYELKIQQVDVSRTLRESLMGNYQILQQKSLDVDVKLPDHAVWVSGDTAALERIFQNLFQNAARYADTMLQISIDRHKNEVFIYFQNDTRMLAAEDVLHLFDRFYIQDHARSRGGTGLGLTVARSLAEQMGGMLTAQVRVSAPTAEGRAAVDIDTALSEDRGSAETADIGSVPAAEQGMDSGQSNIVSFELKLKSIT